MTSSDPRKAAAHVSLLSGAEIKLIDSPAPAVCVHWYTVGGGGQRETSQDGVKFFQNNLGFHKKNPRKGLRWIGSSRRLVLQMSFGHVSGKNVDQAPESWELQGPDGLHLSWEYVLDNTEAQRRLKQRRDQLGSVLCPMRLERPPSSLHLARSKHTHTCAHQVFEECCELFCEYRELEESWTQVRIVSVDTVFPKLLQGLSALLLILYMSWKHTDTKQSNINITVPSNTDPPHLWIILIFSSKCSVLAACPYFPHGCSWS